MKKFGVLLAALVWFPLAACATDFKEGVHYEVLPSQPTSSPEVVEFFSFFCGHCYHFEETAERLANEVKGAEFSRAHVEFLGRGTAGQLMTRGYAVAQVLKVEPAFNKAVFKQHFVDRNYIQTEQALQQLFASIGVNEKDFNSAYNSFPTNSLVARMAKKTKAYGINATPTVVVNGKYKVKNSGLAELESPTDEFINLVNYLLTLK